MNAPEVWSVDHVTGRWVREPLQDARGAWITAAVEVAGIAVVVLAALTGAVAILAL